MKVNFNPAINNVNFKALDKKSERLLRSDIAKYNDSTKDLIEKQIEKENTKTDRTVKISSFKKTDKNRYYFPISYRNVKVKNNLTGETYKTTICCDEPESFAAVISRINSIM